MYSCYRTDHRKFKRYRVNLSVMVEILGPEHVSKIFHVLGRKELEAKAADISQEGLGLLCSQYVPAGSHMSMRFVIFESDSEGKLTLHEVLKVEGEVAYVKYSGDCEYRLGVALSPLAQEQKTCINDILFSCLKENSAVNLSPSEFLEMNR